MTLLKIFFGTTRNGKKYTTIQYGERIFSTTNDGNSTRTLISRALTRTTDETGMGIFEEPSCIFPESTEIQFEAMDMKKTFRFRPLPELDTHPILWKKEIQFRVKKVLNWVKSNENHHEFSFEV